MTFYSDRFSDHTAYYAEQAARRKQEYDAAVASQKGIDALPTPQERRDSNRSRYKCGTHFVPIETIPTWATSFHEVKLLTMMLEHSSSSQSGGQSSAAYRHSLLPLTSVVSAVDMLRRFPPAPALNNKISLYQGDITALEVDAIVNAANESLLGGGGIDGAIHSAAGPLLLEECKALQGCPTGCTKMTRGYQLPAFHVLHTVGPMGRGDGYLVSCYTSCLEHVLTHSLRTVAFCCIGTGIFGFPLVRAAHIALYTVRKFLDQHADCVDRIVFCVFRNEELEVYQKLLPSYFPIQEAEGGASCHAAGVDGSCPEEMLVMFDPNDKPQFRSVYY